MGVNEWIDEVAADVREFVDEAIEDVHEWSEHISNGDFGELADDLHNWIGDASESLMMRLMELLKALEISLKMSMKTLEKLLMTLQMISVESSMALTTLIKTIVKNSLLMHSCPSDPTKNLLCHLCH